MSSNSESAATTQSSENAPAVVGIDLGTTNSAIAFVDALGPEATRAPIELFKIGQLTGAGEFAEKAVLPSFLYLPGAYDIDPEAIRHPWPTAADRFVGVLARDHGAKVPARLVASAKSWLCHGKADRRARILPWGAPEEVAKVSPVQASADYLAHIRSAWNHAWGNEEERFLENQRVTLTVPASFDEVARELTLEAANLAGLRDVVLLEEPLAAFYSWLARHERDWQEHVQPGELILICDVGGGTTDLTLVTLSAVDGGSPRFERIAVGDHLILGGDNVDLALARRVEAGWQGKAGTLDGDRWKSLCHQCRQAKEMILAGKADSHRVTLTGAGSRLIGGTLSAELDEAMVTETVLEGFFPLVAAPNPETSRSGRAAITEFGLPYESEPAITRHLQRFLAQHQADIERAIGRPAMIPDHVLFNGGALKPDIIQTRIVDSLVHGATGAAAKRPQILENPNHDTAVALGAAYYGLVKSGQGVRVGSGSPRAYYLGVARPEPSSEGPQQAICLIERGLEEGNPIQLGQRQFEVLANQPVQFALFSSSYRSGDRTGDLIDVDDTLAALPPLQTVIQFGKKGARTTVPVVVEGEYTELGTLALWCRSTTTLHRWQLQFQLRDTADNGDVREQTVLDQTLVKEAIDGALAAFDGKAKAPLDGLVKQIATTLDIPRDDWPLSFIRELADALMAHKALRSRSAAHEARWMNLVGFCARPGFGDAMDPQRLKQLWKFNTQGPVHPKQPQVQSEWWIMWRRLAGGLNPGQQRQLSQTLGTLLQPDKKGKIRLPLQQQLELWMAVANLERLYVKDKTRWGGLLLDQLQRGPVRPQHLWTLSRLGARDLLYGPVDRVVPAATAANWIAELLEKPWKPSKAMIGALVRLARKTGDRTRDLDEATISRLSAWLSENGAEDTFMRQLLEVVPMERQAEQATFGESLPVGLVLRGDDLE